VSEAGGNLWEATAAPPPATARLDRDVSCDVVVIGGGFTGCSAALHLAQGGANVALVEARHIGHGGAGRNVGLVNAGLWLPPDNVEARLGTEAGGRLNAALADGPSLVFSLVEQHGIDCDAVHAGTLHCAPNAAGFADLARRFAQQTKRGAPAELLDVAAAQAALGTNHYRGALLDRRAGTIQPLSYVRGLARAAINAGATIYEGVAARHIAQEGNGWRVETEAGQITARWLLMAVESYATGGVPSPVMTRVHYFQIATQPLPDQLAATILPGGQGAWDTRTVMTSFRMDRNRRFIIGGMGGLAGLPGRLNRDWARRKLAQIYPALADQPIQHAWAGIIGMTGDHLPRLIRLGERGLSISGYNGRGISPGTVFGKVLAEHVLSEGASPLPLETGAAEPAPMLQGLREQAFEWGAAAFHVADAR
jgi:sarcosine oxidase